MTNLWPKRGTSAVKRIKTRIRHTTGVASQLYKRIEKKFVHFSDMNFFAISILKSNLS